MHKFKKIINAIALSAIILVPTAMNTSAISHDTQGSLEGAYFDGQWWTIAMNNCRGNYHGGTIDVTKWGSGNGDVKLGYYVTTRYGTHEKYKTFSKKGSFSPSIWMDGYDGYWGVDGTCTKVTKHRTIDLEWEIS